MAKALSPGELANWAQRAHEMADAAGITAPATAALHREIDLVAKGWPAGAAALERIKKLVDEQKAPYDAAQQATRDYASAQADA